MDCRKAVIAVAEEKAQTRWVAPTTRTHAECSESWTKWRPFTWRVGSHVSSSSSCSCTEWSRCRDSTSSPMCSVSSCSTSSYSFSRLSLLTTWIWTTTTARDFLIYLLGLMRSLGLLCGDFQSSSSGNYLTLLLFPSLQTSASIFRL